MAASRTRTSGTSSTTCARCGPDVRPRPIDTFVLESGMHTPTQRFLTVLGFAALAAGLPASARQTPSPLSGLKLPAGFQAEVYAEKVDNARSMALGPQGTVFVGSQYAGKVHAVVDSNGDHKADRVVVIASGLDQPNGVAIRK